MPQAVVQGTKRDRGLSHRGQHSLVLERAALLQQEGEKNMFSGFPFAHGRGVWGDFTYYDPPHLPPSVHTSTGPCPDAHLFHSRSGYRVFPRIPGPRPVLRGGGFPLLPAAFPVFLFGATRYCKGQKTGKVNFSYNLR